MLFPTPGRDRELESQSHDGFFCLVLRRNPKELKQGPSHALHVSSDRGPKYPTSRRRVLYYQSRASDSERGFGSLEGLTYVCGLL